MFTVDEELQQLFSKCNADKIKEIIAEDGLGPKYGLAVDFDCCDEYNVVGEFMDGVEKGMELVKLFLTERTNRPDLNIEIFKLTYSEYADDDGVFLVVGEKNEIKKLLEEYQE